MNINVKTFKSVEVVFNELATALPLGAGLEKGPNNSCIAYEDMSVHFNILSLNMA